MLHHRRKAGVYITTPQERTGPPLLHLQRRSAFTSMPRLRRCGVMRKHDSPRSFQCVHDGAPPLPGIAPLARQHRHADIHFRCTHLRRTGRTSWSTTARHKRSRCTHTRCRGNPLRRRGLSLSWSSRILGMCAYYGPAEAAIRSVAGMWYPSSYSRNPCPKAFVDTAPSNSFGTNQEGQVLPNELSLLYAAIPQYASRISLEFEAVSSRPT